MSEVERLRQLLRDVLDDIATATETWVDSDAGPASVPGEPRSENDLDIAPETIAAIRSELGPKR